MGIRRSDARPGRKLEGRLIAFISSKMDELRDVREVVAGALEGRGIAPWVYEEDAGAKPETVLRTSLRAVEDADVYVGLFWRKYGEVTAQEFRHARSLRKPCFVYVRDRDCAREEPLERFLASEVYDLQQGVTYDYFGSALGLGQQMGDDIMAWAVTRLREMSTSANQSSISHRYLAEIREEIERLRTATAHAVPTDGGLGWLAQQMQAWFVTLGYQFEDHEVRSPGSFEWLVKVPGRRGDDRVVVHGVEGEAQLHHLGALRVAVQGHKADEGWLVSVRRVSQAARHEARENASCNLCCYTFDELLDENADFTGYLTWLQGEVRRRHIDTVYVPLACLKDEFDPRTGQKLATNRYDETNGWAEGYLDQWLDDPSKEHISILGEFGTGKTWLCLHYAWVMLKRYCHAKERGLERPRLPLVIPLRDYAKAVNAESLFSEFFFRRHEIPLPGYSAFEKLNRMGKLLLIFDGFDEMAARVDRHKMISNFWELSRVLVPGSKAIMTCRTEHFPDAKEGRALLNAELQASTERLTGEPPQFEVVELEKFSEAQIRQVLSLRANAETVDQVMGNPDLVDLARRPLMVEFILEALPDVERGAAVDLSRVYLYAVRRKMERDIEEKRTFGSLADKLYFLCELSWEMLSTDQMSLNYRVFPNRLRQLFGEILAREKDLDHWAFDMRGQTMLIRNEDGDYSPAHRSIAEFFAAYKFVAQLGVLASDFTEMARSQSHIDASAASRDYTWSTYFRRETGEDGQVRLIPPLRAFDTEAAHGKEPPSVERLPRNAQMFAAGMVSDDPADLDKLCELAWEKTGRLAWDAASLIPFLKQQHSEALARMLVEKSRGGPLRSGVAWVLGELGVTSEAVIAALEATADSFLEGDGASASAWWESAFALEKLGCLGPRKGHQGDEAVGYLVQHLPRKYTYEYSLQSLNRSLAATDRQEAAVDQASIVGIVKHEEETDRSRLFRERLSLADFSADTAVRRVYYVVWLCGHLIIRESLEAVLQATKHPLSSVRNCACEALGKMRVNSPEVVQALVNGLQDAYYRTRFHAAWSLGELGSTSSVPELSAAIKVEEVRDVREEMERVRQLLDASCSYTHR